MIDIILPVLKILHTVSKWRKPVYSRTETWIHMVGPDFWPFNLYALLLGDVGDFPFN